MSQVGKLPEGIQHVEDRGSIDMFLDAGCTVLSDCMSQRAAHQCPCCCKQLKLAGQVNTWRSRRAKRAV